MSARTVIGIVTAANRDMMRSIWDHALGSHPMAFGIALARSEQDEVATHYAFFAPGIPAETALTWQRLCDGFMPDADWAGDNLPLESQAIAACTNGNLAVISCAGLDSVEPIPVFASLGLVPIIDQNSDDLMDE